MTYARAEVVNSSQVGVYHCISRCVRRAFLCGEDSVSGRSFEHRREWIRKRLSQLIEIFAIEVIAYAVMNNHIHILIRIRPDIARTWTSEEIARRWRLLFPKGRGSQGSPLEPSKEQIRSITSDPEKVELFRERLSSLSWFNRCLNEHIARAANKEDDCTGRFWEGRFKCQRVEDIGGIIACAAYIDLNPIRAKVAKSLQGSDHTSIQDRIHRYVGRQPLRTKYWANVKLVNLSEFGLDTERYIKLLEDTAKLVRKSRESIPLDTQASLQRLKIKVAGWENAVFSLSKQFKRVVGSKAALEKAASQANRKWMQGMKAASLLFF